MHYRGCKSCEITPTTFVVWSLVVYKGGEALGLLAKALLSEIIREQFGVGLVPETHLCMRKTRELSKELPNEELGRGEVFQQGLIESASFLTLQ